MLLPKPRVPRLKPKPDAPAKFDVDSVLAMLDKRAPPKAPQADAKVAETTRQGLGAQNALTADLRDILISQMYNCWNNTAFAGAPHPEQLIVKVRVFFNPDGSLSQPPQLAPETLAAEAGNRYMTAAADAALRAIKTCAPYKNLPVDRYSDWRETDMILDPRRDD